MSNDFNYADHVLKHLGFEVDPIERGEWQSADWKASIAHEVVLVEEKTKFEDPSEITRRDAAYRTGQPYDSHIPFRPDNRFSGISQKAASQLAASAAEITHHYRLIWLTATGHSHEAKFHQYITTLYGSTNIIERDKFVPLRRCYFYRNSDFFRYRDRIDGAVVADSDGQHINLKLCLNPLSPNITALRSSKTRAAFGTAVQDPFVDEAEGGAFIADCDIDRSRENDILEYLRKKYGTDFLMQMDMGMASVSMVIGVG